MKLLCVLALIVAVARAAPAERSFQLAENEEPADAAPDDVEDDTLRTHVLSHGAAVVGKKVEVTIKKAFVKSHAPVAAVAPEPEPAPAPEPVPVHPAHAHAHAAHAAAHVHEHPPPHPAHVHAHAVPAPLTTAAPLPPPEPAPEPVEVEVVEPAIVPPVVPVLPVAPVEVVLENSPIEVDKDKIAAILKKLLSGAINNVKEYGKPLVAPPGGKPVAIVFSAAMHVVDLGTLQTLVSANAAATHPSYDAADVEVKVVKLAEPYAAEPVIVAPAKYAAPAPAVKKVVVVEPKPAYAAAKEVVVELKPAYAPAKEVVVEAKPAYAPAAYAHKAPAVVKVAVHPAKAYAAAAPAVVVKPHSPKAYVAPAVTTPSYPPPAELEVVADAYVPAPPHPIKKVLVAKDDY